jgi:hypothetical protein
MKLLEKDVHEKQDTIISLRFVISLSHFLRSCWSESGRSREYVGENLHALKKSLGQTTEYTQSGDCRFLTKMQETAQYSKNNFYKQVLHFHSLSKFYATHNNY